MINWRNAEELKNIAQELKKNNEEIAKALEIK